MFILDSTCQACSGLSKNQTWEEYIHGEDAAPAKCGPTPVSPPPLPPMTATNAVPQWATKMATDTPTPSAFNFDAAVSINDVLHGKPPTSIQSSQATQQTSTAISLSSTGSSTSVPNPTPPPTSATSSQLNPTSMQSPPSTPLELSSKMGSNVHVGAIAGGIIGGLVLLGLIGVGLFYLRRRRRGHPMAPSAAYKAALRAGNQPSSPYHPVPHRHSDSVDNSIEDLAEEFSRPSSWISSRPISIHSESRFHEHTTS
ncbi:hypothetical protein C8R45DRAFT_617514 [Mycena sanguinolenta]|nr:hypothetical protein C8R45DRAFT_617514 [Mycena sanguinolenta]